VILHLHRPAPPLDRFVELVTYYADYHPAHTKERLLPDGAVEIIVDLTDDPKRLYDRGDFSRSTEFRRAWISGMRRGWIVIEAAPASSMAVIRFRPGGAYPFLKFEVAGITDTVEQLDTVLREAAASLRDRILEAPTVPLKMAAVDAWLVERANGSLEPHPVVEYLAGRLFAPAGIRIADVVAEVGYSQRHVLELFRRWVGLPPKTYGRLRRFQQVLSWVTRTSDVSDAHAAAELRTAPPAEPDWADVAASFGYFDQSHLIRDFNEFAGLTPRTYVASFRGLENYLPIT
jgi:AraC-like DNA-binding protein